MALRLLQIAILNTLIISSVCRADVLLSGTVKYGITNNSTNTVATTTTSTKSSHQTTTNSITADTITPNAQSMRLVPGITLQSIPDEKHRLSIGAGAYLDQTVEISLGIRL